MRAKLSALVVAVACIAQANGQSINKCVGKDGKTTYSSTACPDAPRTGGSTGTTKPSTGPYSIGQDRQMGKTRGIDLSYLPRVQSGKWSNRGVAGDRDICGDPLDMWRRELNQYRDAERAGCKAETSSPVATNAVFIVECPADQTESGMSFQKGRLEISVWARTPEQLLVSTMSPTRGSQIAESTRIGDCN